MSLRELSFDEIKTVSGGNHIPATPANNAGIAMIGTTITGVVTLANPITGIAVGTAFAGISAYYPGSDSGQKGRSSNRSSQGYSGPPRRGGPARNSSSSLSGRGSRTSNGRNNRSR